MAAGCPFAPSGPPPPPVVPDDASLSLSLADRCERGLIIAEISCPGRMLGRITQNVNGQLWYERSHRPGRARRHTAPAREQARYHGTPPSGGVDRTGILAEGVCAPSACRISEHAQACRLIAALRLLVSARWQLPLIFGVVLAQFSVSWRLVHGWEGQL